MGVIACLNGYTNDVECNGILSCDCSTGNQDSPRWLRLSSTDKLNQITGLRNLFSIYFIMCMRYDIIFGILHILCILYIILYVLFIYLIKYNYFLIC